MAIGTFFVAAAVCAACSSGQLRDMINPPRLESVSPRVTGIDFGGVNLEFDAKIANTLPVSIRTPKFRYAMKIEGNDLATGTHLSGLDLPAGGTGNAVIPVRVTYADLFAIAAAVKEKPEAAYTLEGAFLIPALGREFEVPLSYSGTLPVLKAPGISEVKMGSPEVSAGGAKFGITAKILNTNVFPLGISDMGYSVRLGEVTLANLVASTGSTIEAGGSSELRITGEASLFSAAFQILTGARIGEIKVTPTGSIETPWGKVAFSGGAGVR